MKRENIGFALFVLFTILLVISSCGFIYFKVKNNNSGIKTRVRPTEKSLEQKLNEGKLAFEKTEAYKTLQEIRSLNENELRTRTDIATQRIEDAVLAAFNDAYHILAKDEAKISHQDLMLCLYGYLKLTNNVTAFCLKSVPGTIRVRKNRLKGKLSEKVYIVLFPQSM